MATVTVDDMIAQGKLTTLDNIREQLAPTDGLMEHTFPTSSQIGFEVGENWADVAEDEPTSVFLSTPGGTRYQLTKLAALEAGAYAKMPRGLSPWMAPNLYQDFLNWAYRTGLGDKEYKTLAYERPAHTDTIDGTVVEVPERPPLAVAMCRGTITPFSNLALLEAVEAGVRAKYGSSEIYVDTGGRKFHNDLERTNLRLIVPERVRAITNTRVEDDRWSVGVQLANSLIGVSHPGTNVQGYLFRWWCTNGCTDTLAGGGSLSRRTISSPDDAYAWARQAVDEILGSLEGSFDHIQNLAGIGIGGGEGSSNPRVAQVLTDMFTGAAIPQAEQRRISSQMAELGGDMTLYDVQAATTNVANDESLSPRTVDRLLELGGRITHASHIRCDGTLPGGCGHLLPPELADQLAQLAAQN